MGIGTSVRTALRSLATGADTAAGAVPQTAGRRAIFVSQGAGQWVLYGEGGLGGIGIGNGDGVGQFVSAGGRSLIDCFRQDGGAGGCARFYCQWQVGARVNTPAVGPDDRAEGPDSGKKLAGICGHGDVCTETGLERDAGRGYREADSWPAGSGNRIPGDGAPRDILNGDDPGTRHNAGAVGE